MSAFLDRMPDAVASQRDLLRRLLARMEPDPVWRWVELSCSLARGAGDLHSDIDCGAGVRDAQWPAVLSGDGDGGDGGDGGAESVEGLVRGLGEVVDVFHHTLEGVSQQDFAHRHTFVQYADGTQLSLVVMPASSRPGLPPGAVALMDKDGQLARPVEPGSLSASDGDRREWTFLGWLALADLDKYLRRGSPWEAHQRLEEARRRVWQLWAARHGVDYPVFGLTSVLDADIRLPPGLEATVAGLAVPSLRRAARHVAGLLGDLGVATPFADHVRARLDLSY